MKEDTNAISSPGRLIATAAFIDEAIRNRNISQDKMMRSASTLSIEELKTILNGGTLKINGSNLTFDPFGPEMITGFYENPVLAEAFPLENILEFQLSKDYDNETQTASKSLMNIAIKGDLSEDDALEGEKKLQDLSDEISEEEEGLNLRVLGDAIVNEKINEASGRNIAILMPIAFIFVIVVLSVMYRSLTDTFLNLIALIMAIIWVYGIGVLLNLNLGSPMMTTVPVLIIGLGIDYGIHYTSRYREEIKEGRGVGDAITKAGATVGFAILLTTVTTVVGFMSNVISNIETIRHFGILCSLGIISAFILMLTFFPAAKTLIDSRRKRKGKKLVKEKKSKRKKKTSIGKRFWAKIGEPESFCEADRDCVNNGLGLGAIAARTPVRVIVVVLLITAAGVYGGIQLEAEYDFRDFLPSDLEVTETTNILVEDFDFSQETVYILVEGDITQPEVFQKIPEVQEEAMRSDYAVDAREPESPYQIAVSMVNEDSPDYDPQFNATYGKFFEDGRVTEDISQENVTSIYEYLLEHREEEAVRVLDQENDEFEGMVLRIPVDTDNEEKVDEVKDEIGSAAEEFETEDLDRVLVTGGPIVSQSTFESIQDGQIQTLLITFIIALLILMGLYFYLGRGPLLGAITILPLVFVISWTFGTMYFFDIPLNPVTVTIAAITVGLGIDYSIHLTQRFMEDTDDIPHPECALCVSASHTGSALFGSAATTVAGFAILSFAIIPPLAQFGQVSAVSITFAFLAAVFVLPTFLLRWYKFKYE
ncbi:MAG: efflux RND transporter permease subunit [Thermoplasmata archaeon]